MCKKRLSHLANPMSKQLKKLLAIFLLLFLVTACSDFTSEATEFELSGKSYACDGDIQGEIINDSKTGKRLYCNGYRWEEVPDTNSLDTLTFPPAGFYKPFVLKLPNDSIHTSLCTFDGSEPSLGSSSIENEKMIFSTTVVRCNLYKKNKLQEKKTESYFINESINMPVVSIAVPPEFLNKYLNALPCQPHPCYEAPFWDDIEFPAHVEFFENGSKSTKKDFQIESGISIAGHWSKNQIKKSVSITMRKQYQPGRLIYPLFHTRPTDNIFKGFILRNNGSRFKSDYIGDAVATSLLEGTNVDYSRSKHVITFFNGRYYGIYDLREKLNEHFIETNHHLQAQNVNLLKQAYDTIFVVNGNKNSYEKLLNLVYEDQNFSEKKWQDYIDIHSYIDYIAAQIYFNNTDWPHNNVRLWNASNDPWKFIAFDIDLGLDWSAPISGFKNNMVDWITSGGKDFGPCVNSAQKNCFSSIFKKFIENDTLKNKFINRASILYSQQLNSAHIEYITDSIVASIDTNEMIRDLRRFPRPDYTNQCGFGFDKHGKCIKKWARERDSKVFKEFQSAFNLGKLITINFMIQGPGKISIDGFPYSSSFSSKFFINSPFTLKAEDEESFLHWEDGSTDNPRQIIPTSNLSIQAIFKIK